MVLTGKYTWDQTGDSVTIRVPLKGSSPNTVDIYVSSVYVKVNFKPYLTHIDLYEAVNDKTGISNVTDGVLEIKLAKLKIGEWPSILCDDWKDRSKMRTRRTNSMADKQKRLAEEEQNMKDRAIKEEKLTTRKQMEVDERERSRLEGLKAEEKRDAEEKVYEVLRGLAGTTDSTGSDDGYGDLSDVLKRTAVHTGDNNTVEGVLKKEGMDTSDEPKRRVSFSDQPVQIVETSVSTADVGETFVLEKSSTIDVSKPAVTSQAIAEPSDNRDAIFSDNDCENLQPTSSNSAKPTLKGVKKPLIEEAKVAGDDLEKVLPPPRSGARVILEFTPRIFPTPMRESKREEEEDWLLRNRRHLKGKAKKRLDAVDISERDPYWLKGKGDDFFRNENYEAALNAYACALEIDEKLTSCISNRAACFLKLGHFDRCIEDCDLALANVAKERQEEIDLATAEGFAEMPKEFRRTKEMRKKLHIRKGTALNLLKKNTEALREYQLAQELDPRNEDIKMDCARLTCLVQSSAQKDLGDNSFRSKEFSRAIGYYNKALEFDPESVESYSNRSACYLKTGDIELAEKDCEKALALLPEDDNPATPNANALKSKLLCRLGSLKTQLGKLQEAAKLYRDALEFNPTDINLAKKLKRIELEAS